MSKIFTFEDIYCERHTLGPMEVNTYIIYEKNSPNCILVDPAIESNELIERLQNLKFQKIILFITHGHADHIEGIDSIKSKFNTEILISVEDAPMLSDPKLNLSSYIAMPFTTSKANKFIKENDTISTGTQTGTFYSVRGHTPGGMILVFNDFIISGDTLFAESVGRSDFPGGDSVALIEDIRNKIFNLTDRVVFPGHGPETSINFEKNNNQFFI